MITITLDPSIVFRHWNFTQQMGVFMSYFLVYTLLQKPRVLLTSKLTETVCNPDGQLKRRKQTFL